MVVSNTTEGGRNRSMVVSNDMRGEGTTKARPNDKAPHKVNNKRVFYIRKVDKTFIDCKDLHCHI